MSRLLHIYFNNIDLGPPASLANSNLQLPLQRQNLTSVDFHRTRNGLRRQLAASNKRIDHKQTMSSVWGASFRSRTDEGG